MVNALKMKFKNAGINDFSSYRRNPENQKSDLFTHTVTMEMINIQGKAEEPNKKVA